MWRLSKTIEFDAGHFLPGHKGKCAQMHGHRWKVLVEIDSQELNGEGMVIDFGDLKALVMKYDHRVLNEVPPFDTLRPTAENMAKTICQDIFSALGTIAFRVHVTVEETPGSKVTYSI